MKLKGFTNLKMTLKKKTIKRRELILLDTVFAT